MKNRTKLLHLIESDEGKRRFVYDDRTGKSIRTGTIVQGIATIGIGRNLQHKGLSDEEIIYLLTNDLNEIELALSLKLPEIMNLSDVRQAVLVSMAFNLGVNGLMSFKKMIQEVKNKDFNAVAACMRQSLWYRQIPKRAERLCQMMLTDEWNR